MTNGGSSGAGVLFVIPCFELPSLLGPLTIEVSGIYAAIGASPAPRLRSAPHVGMASTSGPCANMPPGFAAVVTNKEQVLTRFDDEPRASRHPR